MQTNRERKRAFLHRTKSSFAVSTAALIVRRDFPSQHLGGDYMKVPTTSLLSAIAAFAFPLAASAQFYGSVAVGRAQHDLECTPGLTICDESDTAFKLLGGYRFTPLIAAEVTYFDLGTATIGDPAFNQDFEVSAFAAGVALHGDFTPAWSWVVRAGLAQVKVDVRSVAGALGNTRSDRTTSPYFGAGIGYRFSKQLSADLSFDMTRAVFDPGNNNRREWDPYAFWLGVTYSFAR
jgi:OmpA-OmpF porin, OOP family